MKSVQLTAFIFSVACLFFSCKKGGEEVLGCEDTNIIKITYTNTGTVPLRVEVAETLTPQLKPVNPVVVLDLAPGATVVKEIQADRYFIVWSNNCATSCAMVTYYAKTYDQCTDYEEKRGI